MITMTTKMEYFRVPNTGSIAIYDHPQRIDFFCAFWLLIPGRELVARKNLAPTSIKKINALVVTGTPLQYMNVQAVLFEGIIAEIRLTLATPPNVVPQVQPWVVNSIKEQIILELRRGAHSEEARRRAYQEIVKFIQPITKHTCHYNGLNPEGGTESITLEIPF